MGKNNRRFIFFGLFLFVSIFVIGSRAYAEDSRRTINSDWTLQQNETIEGDLLINYGTVDLNGYTLTVSGDLLQQGGKVFINGGRLIAKGDYRIQENKPDDGAVHEMYAELNMTNTSDYVRVDGNFVMQSSQDHRNLLTAGLMDIKGDFTQLSYFNEGYYNFYASGTHKIVFSGTGKQVVNFENVGSSRLNYFEVSNSSVDGVVFSSMPGGTLSGDSTVNTIYFKGANDTLDLAGKRLTVKNKLVQSDGTIKLNGGRLIVGDDYRIQTEKVAEDGTITYSGAMYALLEMTNASDYVRVDGDFVTQSCQSHQNLLSAGLMDIKGDFNQLNYSYDGNYNFLPSGTHKVIFSGTKKQVVNFESTGTSSLNYFEVTNNSDDGVVFENMPSGRLSADSTVNSIYLKGALAGLSLSGHKLTVKNNLIQSAGVIYLDGGSLIVNGDYRIQTENKTEDGYVTYCGANYAELNMTNPSDYVRVDGDFVMQSDQDHRALLTSGIMEFKGDFTQLYNAYGGSYNFCPTGTHRVVFSGNKKQVVNFESLGASELNYFEVNNSSDEGVVFESMPGGTLSKDSTIKSMYFKGTNYGLYLAGHTLRVKNNLIQSDGTINIDGGSLIVEGDYRIQREYHDENGSVFYSAPYNAYLVMMNPSDYVRVDGTFATQSNMDHRYILTAGLMDIKGDFTQLYNAYDGYYNFCPTGTHKVVFSGDKKQVVYFEIPGASRFNYFEVTNSSDEGVVFESMSGGILSSDSTVSTMYLKGTYGLLDLAGHTLRVKKNLIQSDATLRINGGSLIVDGDYRIQYEYKDQDGSILYGGANYAALDMTNASDYVMVGGDFFTQSNQDHRQLLTDGVMELKGDFSQILTGYESNFNFSASGTHKVVLSGTGHQSITFDTATCAVYDYEGHLAPLSYLSQFNTLEINNSNYSLQSRFNSPYEPYYYNVLINRTAGRYTGAPAVEMISSRDYLWDMDTYASFWADPVDTATGGHVIKNTLLKVNGAVPLYFEVSCNSLLLNKSSMGRGWDHNFSTWLEILPDGAAVHWGANRKNSFALTENGYASQDKSTRFDRLIKNQDGTFILTRKDQSVYVFDASGKLIETRNNHGQALKLSYDQLGYLSMITEPISGQALYISFNADGLINKVWDNLNREVTFGYDENQNLINITDPNGFMTTYTYNKDGRILTAFGSDGTRIFENTYDSEGRVATQDDGLDTNKLTEFSYDEFSQEGKIITNIRDRNGNSRVFVHDTNYQLLSVTDELGNITGYTYDNDGNKITSTDPKGITTSYSYDIRGNNTAIRDTLGNVTSMTYDERNNMLTAENPDDKKTTYIYDNNNNLIGTVDPLGNTSSLAYDENSLLISATTPGKGTTAYTYEKGLEKTVTDPTGVVTTYDYDAAGRMVSKKDGLGDTTYYTYDNNDKVTSITDPLGSKYSYTYDGWGNKLTQTDPRGNSVRYAYDGNNNLISVIDSMNNETRYEYDGEGRLVKTADPRGGTIATTYDAKGRAAAVADPLGHTVFTMYDAMDNIISKKDALGHEITSITYDQLNNPYITRDAKGNIITMEYDKLNRLIKETDPMGQVTQYSYDGLDRLSYVTDALQNISAQAFDRDGNRISLTDPNSNTAAYTYDLAGRVLVERTKEGSEIKYSYDNRGLLEKKTNGRGQETLYSYDAAGRLIGFTDPEGAVSYIYDENGNMLSAEDGRGKITMEYDMLNRVNKYTDVFGNTIEYGYDEAGNLITLKYPGGKTVNYEYDMDNRLIKVVDWARRITSYEYDENHRVTKITRPDGSMETRKYDEKGLVTEALDQAMDGTLINKYSYSYDEGGNIVEESSAVTNEPPIPEEIRNMAYGEGNRLISYNEQDVIYDNDGNMVMGPLNGEMSEYTFDARNRLLGAGGTTYIYDALNNRIGKTTDGSSVRYIVNPQAALSQVLIETDSSGTPVAYYVYGIGLLGKEDAEGGYHTYHFDSRGSTTALTDMDGKVTDRYSYDLSGNAYTEYGSTPNPFLYNGRDGVMRDENGLYYMRARYYNPEIQRFINQDIVTGSIKNGQSLNRFSYANNNPVIYVDPNGQWAIFDDLIASGIGAVVGMAGQLVGDVANYAATGEWSSSWEDYAGAAIGGAVAGETALYTAGNPFLVSAAGSAASSISTQLIKSKTKGEEFSWTKVAVDTAIGTAVGTLVPGAGVDGVTSGLGSFKSVYNAGLNKIKNGVVRLMGSKVMMKGMAASFIDGFYQNAIGVYLSNRCSDYFTDRINYFFNPGFGYK